MAKVARHKIFISYHHDNDQEYADILRKALAGDVIDRSVADGMINDDLPTEVIWGIIRNHHLADSTVTVVLIGKHTWSRKYVDWEIGSSLNKSKGNSRCGVLGILLPDHPSYGKRPLDTSLIPPRLALNIGGTDPYVRIYDWPSDNRLSDIRKWIHTAFERRNGPPPNNYSKRFQRNRSAANDDSNISGDTLGKILFLGGLVVGGIVIRHLRRNRNTPQPDSHRTSPVQSRNRPIRTPRRRRLL